ncbi:MAG: hypothetical protein MR828_12625 [Clostridiales bacterium]|nr:hypothetical protein [Clostridiales bacterium]
MDSIKWALVVGIGIGICVGGWYWIKNRNLSQTALFCFSDLIANQEVLETANGRMLASWFRENADAAKGTPLFFLAKPCAQTVEMFGLDTIPQELDTTHNLLQAVVDEEKKLPVAMRMVSFGSIDADLEKAFNGQNFLVVKSDT